MKYNASMDTVAKVITLFVICLFVVISYKSIRILAIPGISKNSIFIHLGIILFLIAVLIGCYIYAPKSYIVDADYLTIVRPAQNIKIRLADIADVRPINLEEMRGTVRTFGVGGLFGYFGRFNSPKLGMLFLYTTQRKNRILISTKQARKIVISPDDINIIQDIINRRN